MYSYPKHAAFCRWDSIRLHVIVYKAIGRPDSNFSTIKIEYNKKSLNVIIEVYFTLDLWNLYETEINQVVRIFSRREDVSNDCNILKYKQNMSRSKDFLFNVNK